MPFCAIVVSMMILPYFRNIASMRRVTAKPPNIFTAVSATPATASARIQPSGRANPSVSGGAICTSAPIAMMLEMAAEKIWNDPHKLDHLTVGLGHPDAVAALSREPSS